MQPPRGKGNSVSFYLGTTLPQQEEPNELKSLTELRLVNVLP